MKAARLALGALITAGLGPLSTAVAQPDSAHAGSTELVVDVAAPCADAAVVGREVEELLERPLRAVPAVVEGSVTIDRRGATWTGRLVVERDGAITVRELTARTCEGLASASALMIALALDPSLGAASEPPPATSEPQPPPEPPESGIELVIVDPEPEPAEVDPQPLEVEPTDDDRLRVGLGIHGGVEGGALASLTPAVRVSGALQIGLLRIELDAAFVTPATAYGSEPGATATTWLAFGAIRAAAAWRPADALLVLAGIELDLGVARARAGGVRVEQPTAAALPWCAAFAALAAELDLTGAIALRARVAAGTPLVAPRFEIQPIGALDEPSLVLFSADLGLRVWIS